MTRGNEIKILLVEDNPGDAYLIKEALKESIYQHCTLIVVECFADAKKLSQENIVLLLLDLGLPDSNGLETATQMRTYFPDSAFIILTGLADDEVALEALRQGAQNYLLKDEINSKILSRTIGHSLERHEIILQLKATDRRLVEAQAVAKLGSWETDLSTLKVICSLETYRIFELDPSQDQVTQTLFLEYVHPDDRLKVDAVFKSSPNNTDYHSIEHRVVTGKGNQKWVEEKWKIFHDETGKPIKAFGTCQDITERKVAEIEKALLINNTEESFILLDKNLTIVSFNNQFHNLYKLYLDQIIQKGKSILEYAQPERREIVKNIYRNVLAGKTEASELNFPLPDGSSKIFSIKFKPAKNDTNEIIGVFVTGTDITERKQAEQQIQSEKFLSDSIINSLPGIFYLYDQNGRFTRWNKNFETISGYSAAEISLMHPLDFYDEDEKPLLRKKIDTVFTKGRDEVTAHFYSKDKKKSPYYFSGHKIEIHGSNYLIGVGIDITERIKAEKELVLYTEEIKRLTAYLDRVREEERSRIAREIHDELGQQLTGLKMDASWIAKSINKEDTNLHTKLINMIGLIDETVKSVRRISADLRPGILDDLGLIPALEWQSSDFEKRSKIKCVFHSDIDDLNIERNMATGIFRIYQEAFTNVLRHAEATRIESCVKQSETGIMLIIKDNGQGFDQTEIKKKGTLGLIGMRERASILNGKLHIESKSGKGTSVMLSIGWDKIIEKK